MIHVCSLADLHPTVKATGASHVLTVMAKVEQVERPPSVLEANHLRVQVDDITEVIDGFVAPSGSHVEQVLDFVVQGNSAQMAAVGPSPISSTQMRATSIGCRI